MKTLSVQQPWATFIAQGWKTIEVRTWRTDYRGALLIAASKGSNLPASVTHIEENGEQIAMPRGVALCVVDLLDVRRLTLADAAPANLEPEDMPADGWAWLLGNPRAVEPIPIKGKLSLYDTPDELIRMPAKRFPKPSKEVLEIVQKWLEPKILPCDEPPKIIQAPPPAAHRR